MNFELQYRQALESKINSVLFENRNILNSAVEYNEDEQRLAITLEYENFTAMLFYLDSNDYGYTFLENENTEKCLITKFKFPYSDIVYSIYDVHNCVDDKKFDTYIFHCIYSECELVRAVDTIIAFINRCYSKLIAINNDDEMKARLDASFDNGLALASKKITREKLLQNPEKYYDKHDFNLYLFRSAETVFTNHINNGKTKALQRFYASESKKNHLLTYEERYLEHLFENDFCVADDELVNRVQIQEKTSGRLNHASTVSTIISIILALALNILIALITENKIEKSYYLFKDVEIELIIPLVFYIISFSAIINEPIKRIIMKNKQGYNDEQTKDDKKIYAWLAVAGVVVIIAVSVFLHFDYQKAVGINNSEIYYCQKLGRVERLSYDDVSFFMIEGDYVGDGDYSNTDADKRIVIVRDNDYENYYVSDYLEYISVPGEILNSLEYDGSYYDLDSFCKAHNI